MIVTRMVSRRWNGRPRAQPPEAARRMRTPIGGNHSPLVRGRENERLEEPALLIVYLHKLQEREILRTTARDRDDLTNLDALRTNAKDLDRPHLDFFPHCGRELSFHDYVIEDATINPLGCNTATSQLTRTRALMMPLLNSVCS